MSGMRIAEGSFGGWRMVAAAWVVAIVLVMLFAGVQALASRHPVLVSTNAYAGVVIPRHDPNCAAIDPVTATPSAACPADVESGIERAEASYYGW
ncbi:MAG TPA: hypothetical protein VGM07_16145 [Stellaceae bacterium]